jgi:phenylacetic acid degradation protein
MALYEFEGKRPEIGSGTYIHPQAAVIGEVVIGAGCYIGAGAALRGDFGRVEVGDGSNVQENAVMHASPVKPVIIEPDVVFAHGALIHDAVVRRGAVVGMGAIVLHNAEVEEEAVVAAGAVVSTGFVAPRRTIVMGNPAEVQKDVTDRYLEVMRLGLAAYQELAGRSIKGLLPL